MDKIHINEQYGSIDMPSEIVDSFEHHGSLSSDKYEDNSPIKYSRYIDQRNPSPVGYNPHQSSQLNLQSSFEDTFLANLPSIPKHKKDQKQLKWQEQPEIALSKSKIVRSVLPCQQIEQYVQVINSSSNSITLTVISASQIQILAGQAYHKNYDSYLNSQNVREMYLEPWEKVEIGFKIMRNDEEIGDVFETITFQSKFRESKLGVQPIKKRAYIQVQIHYVTPKLKINYQGASDVATICLNKVSMNKVSKGKLGDYSISLAIGGIQRFQGNIQARGQISVFPNDVILYKDEFKKINIKSLGKQSKGALILKAKNAKSSFVFGVQLI